VSVPGQIRYTVTGGPDGDLAAAAGRVARLRLPRVGSSGGTWRHLGVLRDGCADLETGGMSVEAVRLTWHRDSPAPSINEVVFAPRE
jgi:hypothetical protein